MKGLKILLILLSLFFVAVIHVNAANITWGDYSFLYQIGTNGANLYVQPDFSTPTPVIGSTPEFSKDFGSIGDPITSRADSIAESNSGLNLNLKAGASGDHLTDGIKQSAYLVNSSGQNNGISNPYGVMPDSVFTQQVTAFSVRRFEVDNPGAFNFNGLLTGGIIDAKDLFVPPVLPGPPDTIPALVDYNYSGGITLYENILDDLGTITSVTQIAFIDLDDLLAAGAGVPITQVVKLRTKFGGDAVNYDLKTQINLDSMIVNFDSGFEAWSEIPEGSLGFMGTETSPLDIEATLSQVPVPIAEIIGTWGSGIWYWDPTASTFTQMTTIAGAIDIAAGDFNADGIADVASSWGSGLWYQDGSTLVWTFIDSEPPSNVTAGDVTGDGRDEIIGVWDDGIKYWDATTSTFTQMTTIAGAIDLAAGDFNADGIADVASSWASGLWYQDGSTLAWTPIINFPPTRVTAGDVTGDGRDEIIGVWNSGIWYWDATAATFTQMTTIAGAIDIAAGDFNADGIADVASSWASGLWYQDGSTLAWTPIIDLPPTRVTTGDVTGQ